MKSNSVVLKANVMPKMIQCFKNLNSRNVMNLLLSKGYQTIILDGAFVDTFSDGIFLFVEEDVQFLIDAYLHLEELLKKPVYYQHGISLNDGLLSFTASSNRTIAQIEFRYCPGLNVANLITHHLTVTEDEYTWWWRSIAHEILKAVSWDEARVP